MNYEEALNKIESLQLFGSRPGLERMKKLMDRLGNPQDSLKYVHVAGTNGKGTISVLTESVLQRAGYRTGLYLSPHVEDFRERMQINGEMISKENLVSVAEMVFPQVEEMKAHGVIITEFEVITAMAFLWFASQKCDLVVLEVGLGGLLDSTNVIRAPLVSVIASISFDHTKILGDTLAEIAAEKCGIIKQGGVTVSYPDQKPEVLEVIRDNARKHKNKFVETTDTSVQVLSSNIMGSVLECQGVELHLPFPGGHQVKNAVTVLAVLQVLREQGFSISDRAVLQGFADSKIPARLEVLSKTPLVILDGAHNPDGLAALARTLRCCLPGTPLVAIMGILKDKDVVAAVRNLTGLFTSVVTVAPSGLRGLDAGALAEIWRRLGSPAYSAADFDEALSLAEKLREPDGALVICGSLYLAGDLRKRALQYWKK